MARLGGLYADVVNEVDWSSDGLVGLVDLHTHPAAHLGYGTNLFFGPPGGDPATVFSNCRAFHGNPGLDNPHGNFIRAQIVSGIAEQEFQGNWSDHGVGWIQFPDWPTWHDRLHQQIRVEMLERAWQGGLRVMVALAVNSHTLALLGQTVGPYDDKSSGDLQIAAIKDMVAGHEFMELALTPGDLRAIIGRAHLAVIVGVELDCLGNFYNPPPDKRQNTNASFNPHPTGDDIRAEVMRLHDAGVRYVFPVHVTDNVFGGSAIYEMTFDTANRFQFGDFYHPEVAPAESQIGWKMDKSFWDHALEPAWGAEQVLAAASLGFFPAGRPTPPSPPGKDWHDPGWGHRNSRGLTSEGRTLIDALMRLGMIVDIDHMSERAVEDTLSHRPELGYPVFAGHCGIRSPGGNERAHLLSDAKTLMQKGGMWGLGMKSGLDPLHDTITRLRAESPNGGFAFGSDCSGLEQLPSPRGGTSGAPYTDTFTTAQQARDAKTVVYRDLAGARTDALKRSSFGTRRDAIYWTGFTHIGMYPDFLEEGLSSETLTSADLTELFHAPEAVARAWELCLAIAGKVPPP